MHPVENYLKNLAEIHSTGGGSPEISYYAALEGLLNEVGKRLKPKVRCVHNLSNLGAGFPDYGLYVADQFQKSTDVEPLRGQLPERGVVEVKPLSDDAWLTARGRQVTKYWGRYGQVLVTNYRDFVFIGRDERNKPIKLETFRLADSETDFWDTAAHPRKAANKKGERFIDYLARVMRHAVPLIKPEDLAWFLASYAREAMSRIDAARDLPSLASLRGALEESLGMRFRGEEGEHFFRATLIQTLFYGIFSSWVIWARDNGARQDTTFNWHEAAWNLRVPMIAALFSQIATPSRLKPLGIDEVLDWTGSLLNRVDREKFFEEFEEEQAVPYFYEPFLKSYDPELRKNLGVWYTPPEIVKYQVARVDRILREDLGIPEGLASSDVYILDPCCGTGAYLAEVLQKIYETLKKGNKDALVAQRIKKAAISRIFGFEILPAPFVVAHLQLGLLLKSLNAPLSDDLNERVGVYLTNALTGWEPPEQPKDQLSLPELQEEREAAEKVKRKVPILVVIGNPPYNAFAGTSPEEEKGLVDPYKDGLKDWGVTKNYLDDFYVRFYRIAERRIVKSGKGIISYISNFSYLGDPSFVIMRKHFLREFDKLWFDCMNGDSRETGKLTPNGKPDPSVFSTEQNREGIRVGTAVGTMVRTEKRAKQPSVLFRNLWGINKRKNLLESIKSNNFDRIYSVIKPNKHNRFSFRPFKIRMAYKLWPTVTSLSYAKPMLGLNENRQGALQDYDTTSLKRRIKAYYDLSNPWKSVFSIHPGLVTRKAGFAPKEVREKIIAIDKFSPKRITRYLVRPYDIRWAYISDVSPLWNRSRPELRAHFYRDNSFFLTRPSGVASPEGVPFYMTTVLGEQDLMRGHAYFFPIFTPTSQKPRRKRNFTAKLALGYQEGDIFIANLSHKSKNYLKSLGLDDPDRNAESAGLIWWHALAIGYSPKYLFENSDGIRQDWPRIPLPNSKDLLIASSHLGKQIAALLNTDERLSRISDLNISSKLKSIGVVSREDGDNLSPEVGDFDLSAGWGHSGKAGITMPGKGKIHERPYTEKEKREIETQTKTLGISLEQALRQLGHDTRDIYLNDKAYWRNIPANVWNYYIGGFQVIKKSLSYREKSLLGRSLKLEEIEYVTEITRRIAAILLLQSRLDENYLAVKSNTYSWPDS